MEDTVAKIKVKKLVPGLRDLKQTHPGEWFDLRAAKDMYLVAGEYAEIPLGVCIKLPEGYQAIIAARSSACKKWGIIPAGGIGIIDNTYCGEHDEWKFPVVAIRSTKIKFNQRICQFEIIPHQLFRDYDLSYVSSTGCEDRGGIGSSGEE